MQRKVELGRRLLELKKPKEAKKVFENALQFFKDISLDADLDRRVAQATNMKFQALYEMNKFEDGLLQVEIALDIFQRSSDNKETDSEVYKSLFAKGKCLSEMTRFEEATWVFVEAAKVYQHISVLKHINFDETSSHFLEHISVCLMNTNNFKDTFIFLHKAQQMQLQRTHDTSSKRATLCNSVSLPYIQGTTEKIRRILNEVGVKVAIKPIRTIGQSLPSPKDPITTDEITCVVYEVPCKDLDFVYVGQTKRDLNSRLKEQQRAIKQQKTENSAL